MEKKKIRITVEGGMIQNIENIPKDVIIEVWDFDCDGADEKDERIQVNTEGDKYWLSIWEA